MILLIDVGNTRIKWAIHGPDGLSAQQAAAHANWSVADIHQQITAQIPAPQRILVSNVAGSRLAALLTDAAKDAWGMDPVFVQSTASACGVRNGYVQPDKLGVDRWLGCIAAYQIAAGSVCVASVGTAMTVDAIDASGRHLGGLIVPGLDLMKHSLLVATSDIAARAGKSPGSDSMFAADTAAAIREGGRHALAALITRCVERMQPGQPTLVLTGGASARIESLLGLSHQSIPDLVLRGLCLVAAEQ
jgi:type III pantothenate kinase